MTTLQVSAGILVNQNKILIAQRKELKHDNKWEFPGGKIEEGENPQQALKRELQEELAIASLSIKAFHKHTCTINSEQTIELHTFIVDEFCGRPQALSHKKLAWVSKEDLVNYPFLVADKELVNKIYENKSTEFKF